MKMENFEVEFTARKFWPYVKPDYYNNTVIRLDGKVVWPIEDLEDWEDPPVLPAKGVAFRLEIPSGTLSGVIQDVVDVNDILETWIIAGCEWAGKFAGLTGGQCGNGSFRYYTNPATTVKTSITTEVLTYGEYAAIRRLVEAACRGGLDKPIWLGPAENQELMRSALACLRTLRKEAEQIVAAE